MNKPIVILGAGGHGKVLFDICRESGQPVRGFLDDDVAEPVHGLPILGNDALLDDTAFLAAHRFALGVGERAIHKRLARLVAGKGGELATLVHPAAILSQSVEIGAGTVVMAGAVINIDARIGGYCIVNTRASIDHDCLLGAGVQISPGATLAGGVNCGENVYIGSGATILPSVKIGAGAYVGAGATVNRDLPADRTVVGRSFRFAIDASS
jgi:sugar O-acyltransferase (sialic acid O-acetyltransferase NeuD family)